MASESRGIEMNRNEFGNCLRRSLTGQNMWSMEIYENLRLFKSHLQLSVLGESMGLGWQDALIA